MQLSISKIYNFTDFMGNKIYHSGLGVGDRNLNQDKCSLGLMDYEGSKAVIKMANPASQATFKEVAKEIEIMNGIEAPWMPEIMDFGIYDIETEEGNPQSVSYHITRYSGKNIFEVVNRLSFQNKVFILTKVMVAVQKLHICGWIHGDLKMTNITYSTEGDQIYLIDFGNAQKISSKLIPRPLGQLSFHHSMDEFWSVDIDMHAIGVLVFQLFMKGNFFKEVLAKGLGRPTFYSCCPEEAFGIIIKMVLKSTNCEKHLRYNKLEDMDDDLKELVHFAKAGEHQ